MKTVIIRNIPKNLYDAIARAAKRNRRSAQQQMIMALERIRILDGDLPSFKATEIRNRLIRDHSDMRLMISERKEIDKGLLCPTWIFS